MQARQLLRLELLEPCLVHYSFDGWNTSHDLEARPTGLGVWVADVPGSDRLAAGRSVQVTFYWPQADRWEGRDIRVAVVAAPATG